MGYSLAIWVWWFKCGLVATAVAITQLRNTSLSELDNFFAEIGNETFIHCFEKVIQKSWFLFDYFETNSSSACFWFHWFETRLEKQSFLFHYFEKETRKRSKCFTSLDLRRVCQLCTTLVHSFISNCIHKQQNYVKTASTMILGQFLCKFALLIVFISLIS